MSSLLRGVDLHVARPRVAVSKHPNAGTDSIIGVAREDLGEVSHEAVYDAMRGADGRKSIPVHPAEGPVARYESQIGNLTT